MGVALVAAPHFTVVRLVRGVDMRMLLPITRVGEPPVAAIKFALKGFLTCNRKELVKIFSLYLDAKYFGKFIGGMNNAALIIGSILILIWHELCT